MKLLILAGGYGTRLYPIVKDIPKALLEVAGKTLIDHTLDKFIGVSGIDEVLVVTNAKFNVFVFTLNAAGTFHTYAGTQAATLAGVVFPTITDGEAVIGFLVVNPTGTGDFVGGTTALDDATVVPNVVYVNSHDPLAASVVSTL